MVRYGESRCSHCRHSLRPRRGGALLEALCGEHAAVPRVHSCHQSCGIRCAFRSVVSTENVQAPATYYLVKDTIGLKKVEAMSLVQWLCYFSQLVGSATRVPGPLRKANAMAKQAQQALEFLR